MCVPDGTGKCHCISPAGPSSGSQRSESYSASGARSSVVAGMVPSLVTEGLHSALLLPEFRYGLGSLWSAAQSGPSSTDCRAGPPASTRYSTLGSELVVGLPRRYTSFGSVPVRLAGGVVPPASGKNATRQRCSPPMSLVSSPTHSPVVVA